MNPGRTGSWVRLGMQQTPWVDFMEAVYRYRFQGTIFEEREGFLSSSDVGASFHYQPAGQLRRRARRRLQRRDLHAARSQRSEGLHGPRHVPAAADAPGAARPAAHWLLRRRRLRQERASGQRGIVAVDLRAQVSQRRVRLSRDARDQTARPSAAVDAHGYSVWVTPRSAERDGKGCCASTISSRTRTSAARATATIGGVAYWFPHQGTVSTALLLDFDQANVQQLRRRVSRRSGGSRCTRWSISEPRRSRHRAID